MQLLIILSIGGTVSGLLSGAYTSGFDGMFLGGSTGLVGGVLMWTFANIGAHMLREYRLNRYFDQDSDDWT